MPFSFSLNALEYAEEYWRIIMPLRSSKENFWSGENVFA